ncbi:transporter substrate-binding domain-containing protein [Salinibacterium sp. SYSU T00001]|uniref:transporter substrate-binding domain-containing protein n=1 Tax=Homoserinimonas sedimenticola TaxID=2986805 RepID=UPI0022358E19|nr:transporter substrate-binding domain-containing protein [Salinibacterium sedimenticola]MCW4384638.1 transporter substrate-binding domain-containing protein [Salinibacterium sedimenticola]
MRASRPMALLALSVTGLLLAGCATSNDEPEESAGAGDSSAAPLYDELPQWVKDEGSLTFGGDSHPPYRTVEADGSITGIDPEFQEMLESQLGVEIEIEVAAGLPAILTGMLSGRYDAFNGPVRTTEEREAEFDAIVWLTTRTSYVFLEDRASDFESAEDLCGISIAGVTGSVTETQVEALNEWCTAEGKEANTFVGLADTNATILAVQSERADALAVTETAAIDILEQTPDTFAYHTQTDEQGAGVDQLAMFAPKSNELGPVLFQAVENLFENGEYAEFMERWGLSNVALDEPLYNPVTGG